MDPCLPYYDQTYIASAYQHAPAISVTNYDLVNPASYPPPRQQLDSAQLPGHGVQPTDEELDSDLLPELTVKVFERVGGGKNYVLRNVQVGIISSNFAFRQFVVREFGNKVCGTAKDLHIGYFKGNKRVWMRTDDDYLEIFENSVMGARLLYGVSVARKPLGKTSFL